ncbi:EAL domain-containing protein [Sulfidibacter corallicola]|uniref:EAL domain-containing protein n=1 Tax=Sulfidibacter corallicola TaxID=2818388 RepID=A0A8A4TIW5_SULCO|nr:EAL domain-containing protein [Sulfidibacter corallicola]QTD49134.1 EAL domain-containing protein [Sulfidibacter corallicola]
MNPEKTVLFIGNSFLVHAEELQEFVGEEDCVETIADYEEAMLLMGSRSWELVLAEWVEPETPVLEMVQNLRLEQNHEDLPVFVLATEELAGKGVEAIEAGATDFFVRPFNLALIRAKTQNVREVRQRIEQVRDSMERYLLAARGTNDGLWDLDLETRTVYLNSTCRELLGLDMKTEYTTKKDWLERVHPDDRDAFKSRLALHLEGVTPLLEDQHRIRHHSGRYIWVLCRGSANRPGLGRATRVAGMITDLTNRSLHDTRTGLPFRGFFMDRLSQAMTCSQLNGDVCYSMLYVDIDRFKVISEGFGHNMVDEVLVAFAERLERCLREGDTLAFLGGDTFVVLLQDGSEARQAQHVANQIHMQLIAPFHIEDHEVFTKASIGISTVAPMVRNPEEVLRRAQTAMKHARRLGSGHTGVYGEGMDSKTRHLLEMESKLRSALDRQELTIYFQPQLCLGENRITGMETLLRWKHGGKMISPGEFIPVAEETDLILPIGEWVLREAAAKTMRWIDMGLGPLRVAVNLSERQFRAQNLFRIVEQVLIDTRLPPECLELELTESIFVDDPEATRQTLMAFHKLGCKVALDDFGTGYSSMSYLKSFPLDTLKIDRAFVMDLTSDPRDAALCSSMISLAHQLNMDVIAEGVESQEQLIILRAFQCDEIQGYFFSKPLAADKFETFIREHRLKSERAKDDLGFQF